MSDTRVLLPDDIELSMSYEYIRIGGSMLASMPPGMEIDDFTRGMLAATPDPFAQPKQMLIGITIDVFVGGEHITTAYQGIGHDDTRAVIRKACEAVGRTDVADAIDRIYEEAERRKGSPGA